MEQSKPWSWERYETYLNEEWPVVLEKSGDDEKKLQYFLERHPCLLPGGEASLESIGGHHGPYPGAVISQPRLSSDKEYRPDFLWLTKYSDAFIPVFIELERATKRWFRKDGKVTSQLKDAIYQVAEWKSWLEYPENLLQFYKMFGISDAIRDYLKIDPAYFLIYGRREEFFLTNYNRNRISIQPDWLEWSTYDRLKPNYDSRNWITIKILKGKWTAISIPPTFDFEMVEDLHFEKLVDLDKAIIESTLISNIRKKRLLRELKCIINCEVSNRKIGDIKINRTRGDIAKHIQDKHS